MVYVTKVIKGNLVSYNEAKNEMYLNNSWELVPNDAIVETYVPTVNGLDIRVNGRLNKNVTLTELQQTDSYNLAYAKRYMKRNTKDEFKTTKSDLESIYNAYTQSRLNDDADKLIKDRKKGQDAYNMLKELGITARLEFNIDQICGYNRKVGKWNNFNPGYVNTALSKMDKLVPSRFDKNNPNYNRKDYTIDAYNDYIIFNFNYIGNEDRLNKIKDWAENCKQFIGKLGCDNYRLEVNSNGAPTNSYSAELYLWWD